MNKRIVLIVVVLIVTTISLFGKDWIEPIVNLSIEVTPDNVEFQGADTGVTDVSIGCVLFGFLWLEGGMLQTAYTTPHIGGLDFDPFYTEYSAYAGVYLYGFYVGYKRSYASEGFNNSFVINYDITAYRYRKLKEQLKRH